MFHSISSEIFIWFGLSSQKLISQTISLHMFDKNSSRKIVIWCWEITANLNYWGSVSLYKKSFRISDFWAENGAEAQRMGLVSLRPHPVPISPFQKETPNSLYSTELNLTSTLSAWPQCDYLGLKSILLETLFLDKLHDVSLLPLN